MINAYYHPELMDIEVTVSCRKLATCSPEYPCWKCLAKWHKWWKPLQGLNLQSSVAFQPTPSIGAKMASNISLEILVKNELLYLLIGILWVVVPGAGQLCAFKCPLLVPWRAMVLISLRLDRSLVNSLRNMNLSCERAKTTVKRSWPGISSTTCSL